MKATQKRPVIYQLFPRVFANINSNLTPNGRIESNGSGKLCNINKKILDSLADMGITHIWYTGVIEHAHDTDYTRYGIERQNPRIVKGRAGSPYAITDYYDIDPDLAVDVPNRMKEFEDLVERTRQAGLATIIDFVPNHLARQYKSDNAPRGVKDFGTDDNNDMFFSPSNNFYYITRQKFAPRDIDLGQGEEQYNEFPAKATGNDCFTAFPGKYDWYETVKLNYGVDPANGSKHFNPTPDTWKKMLDIMLFWAAKGVAGFRCDMAHMVPVEFWDWAITSVKRQYPDTIFIAELYDVGIYRQYLFDAHFDYLYDKVNLYDTLRGINCNDISAAQLTSCWQTVDGIGGRMLNFLENHDEQRFASEFFVGRALSVIPSLVAVCTISTGAVMIYNGQELGEKGMDAEGYSGKDGRTTIFDYWSMDTVRRWLGRGFAPDNENLTPDEVKLRNIYSEILNLVNKNDVIREGKFFDLMYVNYGNPHLNPHRCYCYLRATDNAAALILLNFDSTKVNCRINVPQHAFDILGIPPGDYETEDLLTHEKQSLALNPNEPAEVACMPLGAKILYFKFGSERVKK